MSSNAAAEFAESGIQMLEVVADTVVGYRKRLIDGDVPPDVADEMCKAFHEALMHQIRSAKPTVVKPRR